MALTLTFALSGTAIVALIAAKLVGEKSGKSLIVTRLISRGDEKAREIGHLSAVLYEATKERLNFLVQKQIPYKTRSYWIKLSTISRESGEKYLQKIRDTKLMHSRSSGISEYFDKLREVEKGGGEIDEPFEGFQEAEESVK